MTDINETVDTWLGAWTEPDEQRRMDLIAQVWADDGQLIDPPMAATGHTELSTITAALQGQFPGHTFRRTTGIDVHHDLCRYGWELVAPDGSITLAGMDVAELTADNRLQRVAGFFGDLPPA